MNYYPFHIGDYVSATRHLSWEEDLAYRRLLDTYYVHEKPLPLDHRSVCRLVLAHTDGQREAVAVVLREYFLETENGWIHKRADEEINAMREKRQKQRDKANKRWHKPDEERGNASEMPQHNELNATASNHDADAMPPTPTPTPTPDISSSLRSEDKRATRFDAQAHLVSMGVDASIAADWVQSRKQLKAAPTKTAIDGIAKEAARAGTSLADALAMCCQRGWRGFKAEWVKQEHAGQFVDKRQERDSAFLSAIGMSQARSERLITGEVLS